MGSSDQSEACSYLLGVGRMPTGAALSGIFCNFFKNFQNIRLFTWNEAANIVVCQATVGVGGPSTEINKPLLQIAL